MIAIRGWFALNARLGNCWSLGELADAPRRCSCSLSNEPRRANTGERRKRRERERGRERERARAYYSFPAACDRCLAAVVAGVVVTTYRKN